MNEARNENVDKLRQVGGASVNQPSDKKHSGCISDLIAKQVAHEKFIA